MTTLPTTIVVHTYLKLFVLFFQSLNKLKRIIQNLEQIGLMIY